MKRVIGICALLFAGGTLCSAAAPPAPPRFSSGWLNGKPVYDLEILPVVESTLARMWGASDDVVDVQLQSSEVRTVSLEDDSPIRTYHTATVLRAFKGGLTAGATIVFTQAAGQLELPDKVLRYDIPPLPAGERYVVFLLRHEVFGPWLLVGGRDGAFKIRNGRVEPQGIGPVAEQQRNAREWRFLRTLKRLAARLKSRDLVR